MKIKTSVMSKVIIPIMLLGCLVGITAAISHFSMTDMHHKSIEMLKDTQHIEENVKQQEKLYNQNRIIDIVMVGSSCAISIGVVIVIVQTVVNPLKRQNKELQNIIDDINSEHGDLTKRLTVKSQDEIRELADSSRNTANNIQVINHQVIEAVNGLITASEKVIAYMNENVLRDYHTFVDGGKQYRDDALKIDNAMTECAKETQDILENMVEVKNSIQEINGAVEESAHSSTKAASDMDMLVHSIAAVNEQMEENSTVAGNLKKEVTVFEHM